MRTILSLICFVKCLTRSFNVRKLGILGYSSGQGTPFGIQLRGYYPILVSILPCCALTPQFVLPRKGSSYTLSAQSCVPLGLLRARTRTLVGLAPGGGAGAPGAGRRSAQGRRWQGKGGGRAPGSTEI